MIKSYFITAIRNFSRQKGFTFINITGLAIGLASAVLIFLYIFDEITFDTVHPDSERIYRMGLKRTWEDGNQTNNSGVPGAWSSELKNQFPEVEESVRYLWFGYPASIEFKETEKILLTENLLWVEETYSDLFYFDPIKGNAQNAFSLPNSIALNESTTKRLFGDIDPIGKVLAVNHPALREQELVLTVSAVFEDYPTNSHIRPDYLVNIEVLRKVFGDQFEGFYNNWANGWMASYIRLAPQASVDKVEAGLNDLLKTHLQEEAINYQPIFRKVTDLHFDKEVEWVNEGAGDSDYVKIFASIAFLILIIACINYMNLATARSVKRAKEIGLRKTLGSSRKQLISQFLGESFITTFLAMILALVLSVLVLPLFNQIAQKEFSFLSFANPWILLLLAGIVIFVSIFAGLYPATYLSSFHPVEVLRGKLRVGKGSEFFRKSLVVFQFAISVILLICTGIIINQMNFLQNSKLSKNGEQMVSIRYGGVAEHEKFETFKEEVLRNPNIEMVTLANHLPRQDYFGPIRNTFRVPGLNGSEYDWSVLNTDPGFAKGFDLEFVAGRDFDPQHAFDSTAYFVVNEATLKQLNISADEALGLNITSEEMGGVENVSGTVIGVVKDFPYRSAHQAIGPLLLTNIPHPIDKIAYVKLPTQQLGEQLTFLEETWNAIFPGAGFDYWFLSEEFGRMYVSESRMAELTRVFSILAIIVACLGVLGLASYMAERRTREIGIRKVMGASVSNILVLLSQSFVVILLISFGIAIPIGYLLMNSWLENFAFHAGLAWWVFFGAVALVFVLTLLTVGYESLKAARLNPIEYIRDE